MIFFFLDTANIAYHVRGVGVAVLVGHPLPLGGIGVSRADVFGLKML